MTRKSLIMTTSAFAIALAAFVMVPSLSVSQATENTQKQEQNLEQSIKADCVIGQYGQGSCTLEGKQKASQSQEQKVVIAQRVAGVTTDKPFHQPVDTSFEHTAALLALVGGLGVGAGVVKKKLV